MQIALTKKLATAMGASPPSPAAPDDPLFSWTANWTNVYDGRKEDMIVMVNNATRFTVVIYGIRRRNFKNIETKMIAAIRNTLSAMNLNPEIIDEYMKKSGEIRFAANKDRKLTAWVNRQGFDAAIFLGNFVEDIKYADTFGRYVNRHPVGSGDSDESYIPAAKMIAALVALTGKPAYKYRAFELLVTLDLYIYKATRRLIVPADIDFDQLHILLQRAFRWDNYHLYQFEVLSRKGAKKSLLRIMPIEEDDFFYDGEAKHSADVKLSDCFPAYKFIRYTYDFGDSWEHEIKLVRVIDEHHEESPFLLEAEGQSPPEDIGGVYGFVQFHEAFMNPEHPSHEEMKEWVGNWSPELYDWEKRPRVLWA